MLDSHTEMIIGRVAVTRIKELEQQVEYWKSMAMRERIDHIISDTRYLTTKSDLDALSDHLVSN